MIKFMVKSLVLMFFLFVVACPVIVVLMAIEKSPKVDKLHELSFDNVKRVEQLVKDNKPDDMDKSQVRVVTMSEQDLNLLVSYGVMQLTDERFIYPEIGLSKPLIHLWVTFKIPDTPLGKFINTQVGLKVKENKPSLDYIGIGKIKVPGSMLTTAALYAGKYLLSAQQFGQVLDTINALKSVSINKELLTLRYDWDPDAIAKIHESGKSFLVSPANQDKLIFYANTLSDITAFFKKQGIGTVSLSRLLAPLFQKAWEQSQMSNDPVAENRALLQVVSLYSIGQGISKLVSEEKFKQVKSCASIRLTLKNRDDLPKHFLVSAGLAVSAGSKLSHFVGLSKEVDDSDMGSGFSFPDLAADRAGVRLAELATESRQSASQIQQKMAKVTKESQFMPQIDHLPEGIMESTFKKQYKDLDSKVYAMIDNEINRRINECSVYQ